MPVAPTSYPSGVIPAQHLDADLYSYDGGAGLNGIAFHSQKPILSVTMTQTGSYSAGVIKQPVQNGAATSFSVIDTCALTSAGGDFPGNNAAFRFGNSVPGSNGAPGGVGGLWLNWNFIMTGGVSAPPGGVGAGLETNIIGNPTSTWLSYGAFQAAGSVHDNCAWFLDLTDTSAQSTLYQPGFWWFNPTVPVLAANGTDTSGQTTRYGFAWTSVTSAGATVPSIPVPQLTWGTVTSAALNNTASCLQLLNYPPVLRAVNNSAQSLTNGAQTVVQFPAAGLVDNYQGWATASSTYTAQLPGLYLACPTIGFGTASSAGVRWTGLRTVSSGTTITYAGPSYSGAAVAATGAPSAIASVARILALNAGDTVSAIALQNSGGALPLNSTINSRLVMAWMGQQAASGSVLSYPAPSPSFRFQAGALSGAALLTALNTHLGTDIAFLLNKPYFTGYQATAQTGFANNSGFHQVTIDTIGALPRGGNGDNYGGWSASNHWYVSQLAGWYLVIFDGYVTAPNTSTGVVSAGIFCSSSGGIVPTSTPDTYQKMYTTSTTATPGATAIGLYYLQPGESVYPMLETQDWLSAGTWGTAVVNTVTLVNSQFTCLWMCE